MSCIREKNCGNTKVTKFIYLSNTFVKELKVLTNLIVYCYETDGVLPYEMNKIIS